MKRTILFLILTGCASAVVLEPAPGAQRLPGDRDAAQAVDSRVTVIADPRPSEDGYTPIDVTLRNESPYRLRIRFENFELQTRDRYVYTAIPPSRVGFYDYYPAPYYHGYWGHRWYDPWYDGGWSWTYVGPSDEILDRSLAEGVLEPGGTVRGYVFFPEIDKKDAPVTFRLILVNADSNERFGRVFIPFVAEN